jgi:mono/diheme cytochrome c family protein
MVLRRRREAGNRRVKLAAMMVFALLLLVALRPPNVSASGGPAPVSAAPQGSVPADEPLAQSLGIRFVPGSSTKVLVDRDGKTYLVNLQDQSVREQDASSPAMEKSAAHLLAASSTSTDPKAGAEIFSANCASCHGPNGNGSGTTKTPNFADPSVQASLSAGTVHKIVHEGKPGTAMPAWGGKLSEAEIGDGTAFVKSLAANPPPAMAAAAGDASRRKPYVPADDYLFSLPTGRSLDRHGFYFNFTHRFVGTPAFSGPGGGDTLGGLDDFSVSSFGLRYGITNKLSVSAYRSPSVIDRPIELGVAYRFADEHRDSPLNATIRFSMDGQNDFSKNFTPNFELILSRTVTRHSQFYLVPTLSLQSRELIEKPGTLASIPPNLPGFNTFVLAPPSLRLRHSKEGLPPRLHPGIFQQPGHRRRATGRNTRDLSRPALGGHAGRALCGLRSDAPDLLIRQGIDPWVGRDNFFAQPGLIDDMGHGSGRLS